jgi:cation diffusion facilitator CzcD-associated flavoprotein CzcO
MSRGDFDHEVAIIGAGFSGMGAAIALDRAGLSDFVILEAVGEIGGTWRDNQYPGACCDVPSHLYSFSYELNPNWSHRFSPAPEIHAYQRYVRDQYGLADRIRYHFDAVSADYSTGGWIVRSSGGERIRVRYLVTAVGALRIPHKPSFPGVENFTGKIMHSAEWDHEYDPQGKKIVIIGSAASAVQIIPQLARVAKRLTVMQRTANYLIARRDRKISGIEKRIFRRAPFVQKLFRWRQYLINDFLFHANFTDKASLRKSLVRWLVHRHMKRQVREPALLDKLMPDYEIGCKRLLLSDDYLPALQRENVDLVTEGIQRFTENSLLTYSGTEIEADLVVLATGFETVRSFGELKITRPDGVSLEEAWEEEIRAHRSVVVKGFSNFFMMFGPNSGLGHSSIIIMIEAQARYIADLLRKAREIGQANIVVCPDAEMAYNRDLQMALENTVWNSGCDSWYKDGKGRIFTLWPHTTSRFIREMRRVRMEEYRFFNEEG